ncbi:MerR family transcriptional regulator [Saccharomonospora piscinae]|uniref:MerR family transcriptional regulator n=1 Tax=Saccharomonospora piscinae TaxID=687388 RepID=UPI000464C2F6|nr:MerR family transcriptional regulator [Saccharomonospora piscinae]
MLIGELAARTGVGARLLRYYESQELLHARRGPNGYRTYEQDAVLRVRQIRALLAAGLTTEMIREVLPCAEGETPDLVMCEGLRTLLDSRLAVLDDRIEGLRRSRAALAGLVTP